MFNSLFGLGLKQPVFGGGGGGGGGGGSAGGSSAGAPKGAAKQSRASSPAGKKTPGTFTRPSSSTSGPAVSVSDSGKSIAGSRSGGGYGQDYNNDGRISFGERLRDMTDRGGPGRTGGTFQGGGMLSTAANLATGGFGRDYNNDGRITLAERARDATDGGGAGQSGDRFVGGGTIGFLGNMLGGPTQLGFNDRALGISSGPGFFGKPLAGQAPALPNQIGGGSDNVPVSYETRAPGFPLPQTSATMPAAYADPTRAPVPTVNGVPISAAPPFPGPNISTPIDYSMLQPPQGMDPMVFQNLLQQAQAGNPEVLAPYYPQLFAQKQPGVVNPLAVGQGIASLI